MAARRAGKSLVDWAAFAERVPPTQKPQFNQLKGRFDALSARLTQLPEQPAAIDWNTYRKTVPVAGLVDKFEKQFNALKVPYPQESATEYIKQQEKKMDATSAEFVNTSNQRIGKYQKEVDRLESMTPFEEMTVEEFDAQFPEYKKKMMQKHPHWPHIALEEL